jgi:coenzyme F420-reducing hydrogenase delta subunit
MTQGTPGEGRILLFFCTRQNPADFAGFKAVMIPGDWVTVEVPCSGRVGAGEIMQGLAAGYDKVAILSCGAASCIHSFGCIEAKKAMDKAKEMAAVAGVDAGKLVFIEADDPEIEAARRAGEII